MDLIANPVAAFGEQMERIAKAHNFTRVDIGVWRDGSFIATLWFDDCKEGEIACASARGKTIAEALNNANRDALPKRLTAGVLLAEAA